MALLPQEMVTKIGRAYLIGQQWLASQNISDKESIEVALATESQRWFFKPKQVRTILLTDLRQPTIQSELSHKVKVNWLQHNGHTPANSFVRFPYCVGFGEPDLVPSIDPNLNPADQSHWHLLAAIADFEQMPVKANLLQRLEYKVHLLRKLDSLGLWIFDVSLHGGLTEEPLIQAWYSKYAKDVFANYPEAQLVSFGKTLHDQLISAQVPVNDFIYHPKVVKQPEQIEHQKATLQHLQNLKPFPQN